MDKTLKKAMSWPNFVYEFLGSAFVSMAYNVNSFYGYQLVTGVANLWSWSVSVAHFNLAVSLGALVANTTNLDKLKSNLGVFVIAAIAQISGAFAGMGMTSITTQVTEQNNQQSYNPPPPTLCPILYKS